MREKHYSLVWYTLINYILNYRGGRGYLFFPAGGTVLINMVEISQVEEQKG